MAWFSSMGVAFDIPIRRFIHMLLIAMVFVWSAVLSLITCAEVECDAPAVLIPAILDGNAGCSVTAVSYCACVFARSLDIGENLWAYWWNYAVWMVVLITCWSQKYQSLGRMWSKLRRTKHFANRAIDACRDGLRLAPRT